MMARCVSIWSILGVEPGSDARTIKRAYAQRLRQTNPEDDPEGFQRLRAAYEEALARVHGQTVEPGGRSLRNEPPRRLTPTAAATNPDEASSAADRHEPDAVTAQSDPVAESVEEVLSALREAGEGVAGQRLAAVLSTSRLVDLADRATLEARLVEMLVSRDPLPFALLGVLERAFSWGRDPVHRDDPQLAGRIRWLQSRLRARAMRLDLEAWARRRWGAKAQVARVLLGPPVLRRCPGGRRA